MPPFKRSLFAGLAVVILLGLLAAWWFFWVPNWRPALEEGESYGIDVSSHQGSIDWERVADDGISFAYIKATEGGDFIDERFYENALESGRAGLERGAYHFFTLCTPGRVQAQNFIEIARPEPEALPPAVDLELSGNCSGRPPAIEVAEELDEFIEIVEEAWGREVVLYVLGNWEERYPTIERLDRPLWLRRFLFRPSEDWTVWQLHGYAQVDGITGDVDLNVGAESLFND